MLWKWVQGCSKGSKKLLTKEITNDLSVTQAILHEASWRKGQTYTLGVREGMFFPQNNHHPEDSPFYFYFLDHLIMLNEFHKLVNWRQHRTLQQNTVNHSNLVIHLKLHYTENKSTIFSQATSLLLHCVGVGLCGERRVPVFFFFLPPSSH